MRSLIARVLLLSDLHSLSVAVGEQKGQGGSWLQRLVEKIIFNTWKRWNIKFAIPKMLEKIIDFSFTQKFDMLVVNGDLIECEYNERGMVSKVDFTEIKKMIEKVSFRAPLNRRFIVPGDHELGYRLPLSSDPEGGISLASIANFQEVVGPLWRSCNLGKVHFLFLCSSLMIQKTDHLPEEQQAEIENLREQQRSFIINFLSIFGRGDAVFVFLHDPDAVSVFHEYIRTYYFAPNRNIKIFCGHVHADLSLKAYERLGKLANSKFAKMLPEKIRAWAKGNESRLALFKRYKLQVIPAPGGISGIGIGGGFLTMDVYEDGTFVVRKHKL